LDDPSVCERFVSFLVEEPAFGLHPEWVDELVTDAAEPIKEPIAALLREPPGDDEGLWQRQRMALRALDVVAPDRVAALAERLRDHPDPEIGARFRVPASGRPAITLERSGIEMVLIPGGRFVMGSPESEVGRWGNEGPQHEVELSPFYLARTPVTNEQYGRYLAANPGTQEPEYWADRKLNQPQQPVVGVTWDEARTFAAWTGARLPTEAEWEYACRAGTTTATYAGDLASAEEDAVLNDIAWYRRNSEGRTQPVGGKKANAWGLSDTLGNVWEWCADRLGEYAASPAKDPTGALEGGGRVLRGGSWRGDARLVRAAARNGREPAYRDQLFGFRVARGPSGPEEAEAAEPRSAERSEAARRGVEHDMRVHFVATPAHLELPVRRRCR
jgi:formylglycine-generating enzyme required for sulfatase activity